MIWIVVTMAVSAGLGALFARNRPQPSERAAKTIMDVVLWILIPPVLFFNLVHFEIDAKIGAALGLSWAGNALVAVSAYIVGDRVLKLSRPATGAMITCALLGNTAYLGYPLVSTALGFDQLSTAVSYDILVSVPFLLIVGFSVGAAFGTVAETPRERLTVFFTKNPLLYAAALAMVVPNSFSPDWAVDASRVLVVAILPTGFFAVGIVMWRESEDDKLSFPPPLTKAVAATVLMRLSVVAGFLLIASRFVSDVPDAYVLEAAMSSGVNNLLLANNYGLDRKLAAGAIVWSTLVVAAVGLTVELVPG